MRVKLSSELASNWGANQLSHTHEQLVTASAALELDVYLTCKTKISYSGRMAGKVRHYSNPIR